MAERPVEPGPDALPETQGEPQARAGGTYAPHDYSRAAQRSRNRVDSEESVNSQSQGVAETTEDSGDGH